MGVHGALAIRRHQDVGTPRGGASQRRPGLERDARRTDVMHVHTADLVVLDLANVGRAGAETGHPDNGVGRRSAGHFHRRAHILVDRCGAGLVDQRHAALDHAVPAKKALIGLHQYIENRVADPENVVFR